jgi:hypothetical protein
MENNTENKFDSGAGEAAKISATDRVGELRKKNPKLFFGALALAIVVIIFLILLLSGVFDSAEEKQAKKDKGVVLVDVNGDEITRFDFKQYFNAYCVGSGYPDKSIFDNEVFADVIKKQSLDNLVEMKLIVEALKKSDAYPKDADKKTDETVQATLSSDDGKQRLKEFGATEDGYKEYVLYNSVLRPAYEAYVTGKNKVTDKRLREEYKKRNKESKNTLPPYKEYKEFLKTTFEQEAYREALEKLKGGKVKYTKDGEKIGI